MVPRHRTLLAIVFIAFAGATPTAPHESGIDLWLTPGPNPGEVRLDWSGGQPPYEVYRSTSAVTVLDPGNVVGTTSGTLWLDLPPASASFFYMVVGSCVPQAETCDGVDNDCDGAVDEGCPCGIDEECATGHCVDGVCCTVECAGACVACDVPGSFGTCASVPAGTDPGDDCAALSCAGYYAGFAGDTCYGRQDVDEFDATCNGTGACASAAELCPQQPLGLPTVTCDALCQTPQPGTCTGTTAGACVNIDPGSDSCGIGACEVVSAQCIDGEPNECVPGLPQTEICDNGVDDDCDGDVDELPPDDVNNCGDCGIACVNPHGSTACTGGVCDPTCDSGWGSCDGDPIDGCETSLTTLSNCGDCGVPCDLPNGVESCSTGSCNLTSCSTGFSNCDGNPSNGCEVGHASHTNTCASAQYVGAYDGDRSCGFICGSNTTWDLFHTSTARDSRWFRARVREDSTCSATIEHQVRLSVPAGTDYDLFVYRPCGTLVGSSTLAGNAMEIVTVSQSDGANDDSFDYWVEVRWFSGASCSNWTLQFYGHDC